MGIRGRKEVPGRVMAVALRGLARDVEAVSRLWEKPNQARESVEGWTALGEELRRAWETAGRLAGVAEDRAGILRDDAERAERMIKPSADVAEPPRVG